VEGAVSGDGQPRIQSIDGYRMDIVPERGLVLIFNDDRPGVIGLVGTVLGNHGVNVADMTLSRRERTALMVLKLDQQPPAGAMEEIGRSEAIFSVRHVLLRPVNEVVGVG